MSLWDGHRLANAVEKRRRVKGPNGAPCRF